MKDTAFFIKDDMLLLPEDFPDSEIGEFPLKLAENFENPDIFEIPAIDFCPPEAASPCKIKVVSVSQETALPKNWKNIPIRHIMTITDSVQCGRILRSSHIAQWRYNSRFCGRCGSINNDAANSTERRCPKCGNIEFPRICPAVITAITDDKNRILLAHNKKFRPGLYSLVSGFNEAGESLEDTVIREIKEEVNIEVKDIVYVKSQPWPFPNSLMLGFTARYLSGTLKPDGEEITDTAWFTKDNLPELPGEGSLSRDLINRWLNETLS